MNLFQDQSIDLQKLFYRLYAAPTEKKLDEFLSKHREIFDNPGNWFPLGGEATGKNNYAIIKNQQANPIAALIEKITNSIDAILMKAAYESNIDPLSQEAPKSMEGTDTTAWCLV